MGLTGVHMGASMRGYCGAFPVLSLYFPVLSCFFLSFSLFSPVFSSYLLCFAPFNPAHPPFIQPFPPLPFGFLLTSSRFVAFPIVSSCSLSYPVVSFSSFVPLRCISFCPSLALVTFLDVYMIDEAYCVADVVLSVDDSLLEIKRALRSSVEAFQSGLLVICTMKNGYFLRLEIQKLAKCLSVQMERATFAQKFINHGVNRLTAA